MWVFFASISRIHLWQPLHNSNTGIYNILKELTPKEVLKMKVYISFKYLEFQKLESLVTKYCQRNTQNVGKSLNKDQTEFNKGRYIREEAGRYISLVLIARVVLISTGLNSECCLNFK